MNDTPRYGHDCTVCVFLGRFQQYDLYYCPGSGAHPTIIARDGEAGDYCAGLIFGVTERNLSMTECLVRALRVPEYKAQIIHWFIKYERDDNQKKVQELILLAETPRVRLPLMINDIKYHKDYFEHLLKGE